jgi:hypothetical protein
MCTLSFVPRKNGYLVAMNRDERLTRVEALPPEIFEYACTKVMYPHEPSGGTWIATNQHAVTLALLNLGDSSGVKRQSRGEIVPALIYRPSLEEVEWGIEGIDKRGTLPFRLVAIAGREKKIVEWRWDGTTLASARLDWHPRHWFSSGLSDQRARAARGPVCQSAWQQRSAGTIGWLRRLHRSHRPDPGAFSLCVHRPDGATRSYTEIVVRGQRSTMEYRAGSPCEANGMSATRALPLLPAETFTGFASLMGSEGADARQDRCHHRS